MRIVDAADIADRLTRERVHEQDARVVGSLDLEGRKLDHPLILENCSVEEPILLNEATAASIRLPGCELRELPANQLRTRGDLDLTGVTVTGGGIGLAAAEIGGNLLLNRVRVRNVGDIALEADRIRVGQNLNCLRGTISGMVRMGGAEINGQINLSGTRLFAPADMSFFGDRLSATHGFFCLPGFESIGEFRMSGAQVGGQVAFDGATFANWAGNALDLTGAVVDDLFCRDGFMARGRVVLTAVRARGEVGFRDATVHNPCDDLALEASGISIGQDMLCDNLEVHGSFQIASAQIAMTLSLNGVQITNRGDIALNARQISVGLDMWCSDGFTAFGATSLSGANIGGKLIFSGAKLVKPRDIALDAQNVTIGHGAFLNNRFQAHGHVTLTNTQVPWLDMDGAKIDTDDGFAVDLRLTKLEKGAFIAADLDSLDLEGAHIGALSLAFSRQPSIVDLTNASVRVLYDNPRTWPEEVVLQGFTCERIQDGNTPVRQRIEYLRRHAEGGYEPGLYDNLAAAYRRDGRVERAHQVSMAKQRHRRTELNPFGRAWNRLLHLTVGYGYRTSRAWLWLAALLGAGTAVYATAQKTQTAATVPAFNPFVYALDVLLPIIDLGQEKAWVVKGAAQYVSWGLVLAGWVLTTAVVAGLTNALKRD